MSLGLGVTVGGIVLQIARALHGHTHAMWSDFWPSFVAVGLFSFLSIPVTRRLAPHAGDEIARGSRG
jgi:membrane-associated PAP2 superfamily phosphatase